MFALITGARSGLGRAFASELKKRGYDVIAVSRTAWEIDEPNALALDLGIRENCFALYDLVKQKDIRVVINNAGSGVYGPFEHTDLNRELAVTDINVAAVQILTKLFAKHLLEHGGGFLMNVASSAAFLPGPLFASYYASKAYVLRYTQSVAAEFRCQKKNVWLSAFCPGPIDTPFHQKAGVKHPLKGITPEYAARYAADKMFAKKTVIVPGAAAKAARFACKILPDALLARIAYRIQSKKQ